MLNFFDPKQPARITRGDLPHWWQPGRAAFITFRTLDSVPGAVLKRWIADRRRWLRLRTERPSAASVEDMRAELSDEDQREFDRHFAARFESHLDRGYGECVLRSPQLAEVVASALCHFDGVRYELAEFVVMPNHVHVLIGLIGMADILPICESWKRFTAREINSRLNRTGKFWQPESFDHLVRSAEQFEAFARYIKANPQKAGLRDGEYLLGCGRAYSNPMP